MRKFLLCLACLGVLGSATVVSAQEAAKAPAIVDQFKQFFTPAIGEWRCHIREWDGKSDTPVWQDHQLRRFETALMAEFFLETSHGWSKRQQKWIASGMHLFGVDAKQGVVVESGFWAGMAPDGFRITFTYDDAARELRGTMSIAGADGKMEARRCAFSWEGNDKFFFRVYRAKPDGTGEYLHEELAYARGAFPPPVIEKKS